MQSASAQHVGAYLYRRVPQHLWKKGILKPAALLPDSEEGLSVFHAGVVTFPRTVLQDHIDKRIALLQDPSADGETKQRIKDQIANGLMTVENLHNIGWRIAELPLSAFPKDRFMFSDVEENGHFNITGRMEDFNEVAATYFDKARILDEQETLRSNRRLQEWPG